MLHEALLKSFQDLGGHYLPNHRVLDIKPQGGGFSLKIGLNEIACGRVVLAGGIANSWLGPMVGMDVPVKALRGQILVTERLKPLFDIPTSLMRQTDEGTVMLGDTREDVGLDEGTTLQGASQGRRQRRSGPSRFWPMRGSSAPGARCDPCRRTHFRSIRVPPSIQTLLSSIAIAA